MTPLQPTVTENISSETMANCCALMKAMAATLGIDPGAVKAISVTAHGVVVETLLPGRALPTRIYSVFRAVP